jgi:amidohydrolase
MPGRAFRSVKIIVKGQGGHAAYPHLCIDPVVTAAQIVTALQTLVSREVAPMHPAVVTVAQFHAGTANNVIPDTARLAGTIRTQSAEVRNAMPDRVRRVAEAVCASMRATCRVDFRIGTPGVINDPRCAELASAAASDILGAENVIALPHATMGAEDFARYLDYAPGAILRLGIGSPTPLHSPQFDFNDDALIVGVRTLVAIALRTLSAG